MTRPPKPEAPPKRRASGPSGPTTPEADRGTVQVKLREAIELVGCLRRLLAGRDVGELHRAFGAPGDFGYEGAIGAALSRIYHGEVQS